jgi:hypothetical protein
MRRCITVLAVLLFAPALALAQLPPAPYTSISAMKVPVPEIPRFEEAAKQIVDAAGKAKLKPRFGWEIWQNDNTYAVVSSMQTMSELENPMMWIGEFANTPGQAVLTQAFEKLTGMRYTEETEVMQPIAAWSYTPATMPRIAYAEVIEYWPVAGSEEQFDKAVKEAVAILKSSNYPFLTLGNKTPAGRRRVQFIVLHDDPGKLAAADAKLQANPQWQALGARFMSLIVDMKTTQWRLRPELSYTPAQ